MSDMTWTVLLVELLTGTYNIAIGNGAGSMLTTGSCDILIGDNIQAPTPETSFYINVDGEVFPNSIRSDAWFHEMVRRRAHKMIDAISAADLHGGTPQFKGYWAEAHANIDAMSFNEVECMGLTQ